jgi:hypothetical protein
MKHFGVEELLDRIGVIRHARDLDLLLFCSRHRHVLLTAEQLAAFVGYDLQHVTATVDTMIDAGALKRTHSQTHGRVLYVFGPGPILETPLAALLQIASSRPGRLEILHVIERRAPSRASRKA